MAPDILPILLGAAIGGFVSGLTGFGTALTSLPLYLLVLPPTAAAILAAATSVASQAQTLPSIWRAINWPRALPLIAGGLVGIPLGTRLLPLVSLPLFKLLVGLVLVGYCTFVLAGGGGLRVGRTGRWADLAVGLGGGIMGGLAALSGPLPIIWASLQGWGKDERRGVFQAFNSAILSASLLSSWQAGLMTRDILTALLWALPAAAAGTAAGQLAYRRLDDHRYDRLVLILLWLAGISLILSAILPAA